MEYLDELFRDALVSADGSNSIQSFVDKLIDIVEDNRVKEHLRKYLEDTRQMHVIFNLDNIDNSGQATSPVQTVLGSDGQNYKFYIRKVFGHFCLYISIPPDHPLNGKDYDEVENATFCGKEHNDNTGRWVFGWDYAHLDDCTLMSIYMQAKQNPLNLLNMRIINKVLIDREVSHYVDIFAKQQLM
jgi:hypothetical protein